jgi:alpha-beta hydrolase superfamily lysophospholipase
MNTRFLAAAAVVLGLLFNLGCASLDQKQREWIFQPSDRAWGGSASDAEGMDEVWIDFPSKVTGEASRLHALWLESDKPRAGAPVLLYLHGARWNVAGSAGRMRRLQDLGFAVLAIDYRGFGKSSPGLPSEETAYEDAKAAWDWLAEHRPDRPRYIFGHSLGGAIAIDLASRVDDEQGTIVEGTFTSIPDVASSFKWGWLPVGPLITQRFSSIDKVAKLGSPLLVVHGANDSLIRSDLGQRLFDAATGKKKFVLVEGGSHHSTMYVGQARYREAIEQLFSLR